MKAIPNRLARLPSPLEQLETFIAGDRGALWHDSDGRPTLGWIVRLLEYLLAERSKSDDRLALSYWSAMDELFHDRSDYDIWRKLWMPSFARNGRIPFLRPRETKWYRSPHRAHSLEIALDEISNFDELPRTIRFGIVGTIVDYLIQNPRLQRAYLGWKVGTTIFNSILSGVKEEFIRPGHIVGPADAVLTLCFMGTVCSPKDYTPAELKNPIWPLICLLTLSIDNTFDLWAKREGVPQIRRLALDNADMSGCRYIPQNYEDITNTLCDTIKAADAIARDILLNYGDLGLDIDEVRSLLRARASLMTARAFLLKGLRKRLESQARARELNPQQLVWKPYKKELAAIRDAAEAAHQSDRSFLAAALWARYHWSPSLWGVQVRQPPQYVFGLLKEAGLRRNENANYPKNFGIPPAPV